MNRVLTLALVLILLGNAPAVAAPTQRTVRDARADAVRYYTTPSGIGCEDTGWPTWDLRRVRYAATTTGVRITWTVHGIEPDAGTGSWVEIHGASIFWSGALRVIVEVKPRDTGRPRVYWETDGSVLDTSDAIKFKAGKNAAQDRVWVVVPWARLTCPGTLRIRAVVTLRNYTLYRRITDDKLLRLIAASGCR